MFIGFGLFALGAILASFVGVITERIYTGQSWLKGRSRCNSCRRELNGFDLVPIISWIATLGRCRTCGSRVPGEYLLFEAGLGTAFLFAYLHFGFSLLLGVFLIFLVVLDFIVQYDLKHTIVPTGSMILLVILGAVLAWLQHPFLLELAWPTVGVAALIGTGFYLIYLLSRGRGMGLGDAPISFALSLAVGFPQSLAGLIFSFWIGAVIGIILLLVRRGRTTMKSEIPFVPFLALGYLLALFTGWNPFFLI